MTAWNGRRPSVMLVDDHPLVRAAVRQALEPDLSMIGEAGSAEDALELAPNLRPDVLLVDIDLPGMDGIRLVRELALRLPETRIVMLTVSSSDHDLEAAIRAGACGYLTKDVAPDALVRVVRGAWDGELAMSRQLAARLVRRLLESPHRSVAGDDGLAALSERELEVLRMLAEGLTDRAIAEALTLSPRTVESHVSNILHKLGTRNRAEAAARYRALEIAPARVD
jgi:DNA-binding NarL/FixJ family response regulator